MRRKAVAHFARQRHNQDMDPLLAALGVAAYYSLLIIAVLWVFARKRDAASAVSWTLAIMFMPVLGLLLFLLFGRERMPWRLKGKLRHRPNFAQRLSKFVPPCAEERDGFQGIGKMAEKMGNAPIRDGNKITPLLEGDAAFESIKQALAVAKHHIHIEEYIFRDDSKGRELLDLCCARARAGVEVRLLVDAVGTGASRRLVRDLKRAGGHGEVFLPMFPFGKSLTPNLRNHRKIIVCDGRVGFLGGMNVGDEYFGLKFKNRYWCDWHMRIEGPSVLDLQRVFVEDWDFITDHELGAGDYFPKPERCGDSQIQIVHSGPDEEVNSARHVFFAAITRAQKHIGISSPYFVPDPAIREALRSTALRGVKIEVLTQGWPPEMYSTYFASRFYWEEFMRAGIRIFEYRRKVLHGKGMIVDGEWAAVGSPNLDPRSLQLNFEVMGLLETPADAALAQAFLDRTMADATEVKLAEFEKRGLLPRAAESTARLFGPLL